MQLYTETAIASEPNIHDVLIYTTAGGELLAHIYLTAKLDHEQGSLLIELVTDQTRMESEHVKIPFSDLGELYYLLGHSVYHYSRTILKSLANGNLQQNAFMFVETMILRDIFSVMTSELLADGKSLALYLGREKNGDVFTRVKVATLHFPHLLPTHQQMDLL